MFTSEASLKIRTAIKVKLAELGNDVYEELPDYIMVMVANKRSEEQMTEDLALFLGDSAEQFTTWLHGLLSKLQSVATVTSAGKPESTNSEESKSATPYGSESEHSNEDASYATASSDEASRTVQLQEEEEIDGADNNIEAVNADSTSRSVKNESNISCNTGEASTDNNTQFKKRSKKFFPQTRAIRIKRRKVEPESSDNNSSSDHSASVSSSIPKPKEKRRNDGDNIEMPVSLPESFQKNETSKIVPQSKHGNEVSSSEKPLDLKKVDNLANSEGENSETESTSTEKNSSFESEDKTQSKAQME